MGIKLFRRNNAQEELPSLAEDRIDFRMPAFEAAIAPGSRPLSTGAEFVAQTLIREQLDFEGENNEA